MPQMSACCGQSGRKSRTSGEWLWTFYKMTYALLSISGKICEYSLFLFRTKVCYDNFVHNVLMFLLAVTMDHPVGIPAGKNKEGNVCLKKR